MLIRKLLPVFFVLLLVLVACTTPLPEDKANYVGEWRAPGMYLLITQDGSVVYERLKGGATVSVNGPVKEFEGNNLIVGVGFVTTTFVVSTPLYLAEDSKWKMVVDGVELIKS
jgi:hypothetical protein